MSSVITPESTPVKKLKLTRCASCLMTQALPGIPDCGPCAAKNVLHDMAARRILPEKQCVFLDTTGDCRVIPLADLEITLGGRHFTQLSTPINVPRNFDVFMRRTDDGGRWDNTPNDLGKRVMEQLGFVTPTAPCGDLCFTGPGRSGLFPSDAERVMSLVEELVEKE